MYVCTYNCVCCLCLGISLIIFLVKKPFLKRHEALSQKLMEELAYKKIITKVLGNFDFYTKKRRIIYPKTFKIFPSMFDYIFLIF